MKTITEILHEAVKEGAKSLFDASLADGQIQIQNCRPDFEGHLTVVVFPFVKMARKSPEDTGKLLGAFLQENTTEIIDFNVVKGFLNLTVADKYWMQRFAVLNGTERFGIAPKHSKPRVMVEYSSPNTNKPLHLGHLRNIYLGYSVSRILEAIGHEVVKVQIVNDRGIHICKSMVAWQNFGNGETPESSGLKGDHLAGKYYVLFNDKHKVQIAELIASGMDPKEAEGKTAILEEARTMLQKWEQKDPEVLALWEKMNNWVYSGFDATYAEMGVSFDKLYYESDTYLIGKQYIEKGLADGVFFTKENGSVWCDLSAEGLDEKLVLRGDGTAVYMTQDIGTAILRFEEYAPLAYQIYTVGNEQEYHFKVLFAILEKLGLEQAKNNFHLSYGMVELPDGKMKSREGTVVDADDILSKMVEVAGEEADEKGKLDGIDQAEKLQLYKKIGYGALKYFLLRVDPKKTMVFDPKKSIDFAGNTGPFIQYTFVRTQSILRRAGALDLSKIDDALELDAQDLQIIRDLEDFPNALQEAAAKYEPSFLINYTYNLVKDFNTFYQSNQILREENEARKTFWLALTKKVGETIALSTALLGMEMPDKM